MLSFSGTVEPRLVVRLLCGITEIDLALDRVVEAGVLACKNHLDLELSLARQFLLPLLRSDTYLLEVFAHRHVETFHLTSLS